MQNKTIAGISNHSAHDPLIVKDPSDHCLSREQEGILHRVKVGRNVFFTGCGGTGKSVLLNQIIQHLRSDGKRVAVTATTGIAAVNIGGSTINSWAGIGLGQEEANRYIGRFFKLGQYALVLNRWREVDAIVIDEISLLDGKTFDKLECIARGVRQSEEPFGGIQLVLAGDFFQLPPIGSETDPAMFAFQAETWACVGSPVELTRVFRQSDREFIRMLNEVRYGKMSPGTVERFQSLSRPVEYSDGIEPTELFPRREQVTNANEHRLSKLPGMTRVYYACDSPGINEDGSMINQGEAMKILNRLVVPETLTLKVGAQVMLIKNLEQGILVNGSVGVVESFRSMVEASKEGIQVAQNYGDQVATEQHSGSTADKWPVVRFTNGRVHVCIPSRFSVECPLSGRIEAIRIQVPLILAWALSIHKSQGQTLSRVKIDLNMVFERGQAYVALSRATSMETLQVLNFESAIISPHPRVLDWYRSYGHSDEEWGNEEFKNMYFQAVDERR